MMDTSKISEILTLKGSTVWRVCSAATVFDAVQIMADRNVGALAVVDDGQLVGMVSERDYTRKVMLHGKSSKTTPVREILTGQVISVTPDHTVEACLRLMTEHRVRHLPVLVNGQLAGIISIGDLVNWIISAQHAQIEQLRTYITGLPA